MIWKRINISRYLGVLIFYIVLSVSDSISLSVWQYILFIVGNVLISIEKEETP